MTPDFEKFCLDHCCAVGCEDRMDYCPIADTVREQYGKVSGTKCEKIYIKVLADKENEDRNKKWGSRPTYMLKSTPVKTMYDRLVSMTPNEMALWFAKTFGDEGDYKMWMKFLCASAEEGE